MAVFLYGYPDHGIWPMANAEFWREKIVVNQNRDRDTNRHLEDDGWCVIRMWVHHEPEDAADLVVPAVRSRTENRK